MRLGVWSLLAALVVTPKLRADEPASAPNEGANTEATEKSSPPAGLEIEDLSLPEDAPERASPLVVRVLLKGCSEFTEEEVERVLSAELAVEPSHSESVHEPTWVVVQCAASKVVVEVNDPVSRKIVQRRFDFGSSQPKARGRLVALAAAELVLASWAELSVLPAPRIEPEGKAPSPEQKNQAQKRVGAPKRAATMLLGTDPNATREERGPAGERIVYGDYVWERLPRNVSKRLLAFASLRKFPGHEGTLLGGGVRFGSDSLPLHGWTADVLVESGNVGSVHVENWTLGGMLYFVKELHEGIVTRAGAGLRAGFVRSWDDTPNYRVSSPVFWGWPLLALSGSARFGNLVLDLATEAGYATLPASPGSTDSSRGIWLNLQLGFGARF